MRLSAKSHWWKIAVFPVLGLFFLVFLKALAWPAAEYSWTYCYQPALLLALTGGSFLGLSWYVMKKTLEKSTAIYR